MPQSLLAPPVTAPEALAATLRDQGYGVLSAQAVRQAAGLSEPALHQLAADWDHLPPDAYLRDGGRYRRRRHESFMIRDAQVVPVSHRAHWQSVDYNALHGGMARWFEPIAPDTTASVTWQRLLCWLGTVADGLWGVEPWYGEAHQFRIDTTDGIGRPTPEGAHRDGVDLVAVFLVARQGVKGGETRVFDAAGPTGQRFTLTEPWSVLLLDDHRVIHESTPIQPLAGFGWRDTMVVTLRAVGFPDAEVVDPSGA
jgi:hypothetical protein